MSAEDIKICTKCNQEKDPVADFDKSSRGHKGLSSICKECRRKKARRLYRKNNADRKPLAPKLSDAELSRRNAEGARRWREKIGKEEMARRRAEYYLKNGDSIRERQRVYRSRKKEQIAAQNKKWRDEHKEYLKQRNKEWRDAHPGWGSTESRKARASARASLPSLSLVAVPSRVPRLATQRKNEYARRKRAGDSNYKTCELLRSRLSKLIRREVRSGSAVRDLGCTVDELRVYLESKFYVHPETGEQMTWKNHTTDGWHIDHVKPLSKFDLTDPEQFKAACHYTNLRPLWAKENLRKGNRVAA